MLPEMDAVDGNKVTTETLGGVSLSSQVTDDSHEVVKPSSEKRVGDDLGSENEVLAGDGGGDVVVITKTVVEESEVSVVKVIQEDKEETEANIVKNQENEKEGGGADEVVITETVVEEIEVSVVNMIQEDKEEMEGTIVKNQENDVQEKEKEGVFGNFFGDDEEDMKVKCNENGVSVKGSLDGEDGSEMKPVTDSLDENTGGDPKEFCLSDEKTKKHENGADVFGSNEEMIKNDEENVKENGEIEDGEEDESEEDHDFVIGDFVWGKIKSHPWWPGQIYDPSDASDFAAKLKRKGRLLVAYFGDGSFSWCSPSQLKPFVDHFEEMSKQSNLKNFMNAVQNALDEISRLVEAELVTVDQTENDREPNSGIKAGVDAPKGNTIRVLIDRMGPIELLSNLKSSATMEFEKLLDLDLTVVRSCLSAFYKRKGGYFLPVFHEPKCIEGLEDKIRTGNLVNVVNSDINGPSENTDDKLYQGRKQKSVAELLGEVEDDEPKIKKAKTSKNGGSGSGLGSGMKKKRKVVAVVVPESPESDHESGGGEEEITTPRQRKKSKYLSPPYTNPIWGGRVSGSGSVKEAKPEPEKDSEMADNPVQDSSKKSSGKKPRQKRRQESDSQDSKEEEQKKKKIIDAALNVSKMLNGLLRAALDPSSLNEHKYVKPIMEFVSSFRSSVFKNGSKDSPMTLVVEFPSGVSLPTKSDLLKTYRKFGDLVKKETRIRHDRCCAFVGFVNGADAEAALDMSLEEKPFGDVKYHLAGDCEEEATSCVERAGRGDGSGLWFVKQKVEGMMEMVKKCGEGEMCAEMKAKLEEGMKEVLEKVSKMG